MADQEWIPTANSNHPINATAAGAPRRKAQTIMLLNRLRQEYS
jgi:hypothetical protein